MREREKKKYNYKKGGRKPTIKRGKRQNKKVEERRIVFMRQIFC